MLSDFKLRAITALVAVPAVLYCVWLGSPYLDILVGFLLVGAMMEWSRLILKDAFHYFNLVFVLIFGCIAYQVQPLWPTLLLAVLIFLGDRIYCSLKKQPYFDKQIFTLGAIYICLSMSFAMLLAREGILGQKLIFMALLLVWFTDTGAYMCGSLLKGPKLAPRISPNKTWSGLAGGTIVGAVVGSYAYGVLEIGDIPVPQRFLGLVGLSVIGHLGDLVESFTKRLFKAKDTGSFFPGHGGLLDRLDSLLAVLLVIGVYVFLGGRV